MKQKLTISPVILLVAVISQVVLALICGYLMYDNTHKPQGWSLDSTDYYKFKEGQGRLNLTLYNQQQSHEERLRKLDKKRKKEYRHIDSLSGDALQQEIDRQFNQPGQPQSGSATGSQAHRPNGSGRSTSPQGQSGSAHAAGSGSVPGLVDPATETSDLERELNDPATQRTPTGQRKQVRSGPAASRRLPSQVAQSPNAAVDHPGSRSVVYSHEVQTHLTYWRLIQGMGFIYPDVAFAISAVETGYWWKVPRGNNLFGFKKNGRGFYNSLSNGYCMYDTQRASLSDYGAYEKQVIARYKLHSRADYVQHIQRRYCPSPSYPGKLLLAFQKLERLKALA